MCERVEHMLIVFELLNIVMFGYLAVKLIAVLDIVKTRTHTPGHADE